MAGTLQACLYLSLSVPPERLWLYYLDPRLGMFAVETALRGAEIFTPDILRWFSVLWLLLLGGLLCSGRRVVKTYIISEIVLSLPNLLYFVATIMMDLSSAHGFSIVELPLPTLVMIGFSVVPLILAFQSRGQLKLASNRGIEA